MTIVRVQEGDNTGVSASITVTMLSPTTTGNLLVVKIRLASGTVNTVLDGTNTFNLIDSNTSQDPCMFSYYAKNIIGVSANIVISHTDTGTITWACVVEYSGLDTTAPLDTHDNKTGSGVTDLVSNSITTAQASELIILGVSQNNFAAYTAGANYTLVNGSLGDFSGSHFGAVEEFITSGTVSSAAQHITSSVSNQYTMVLAAFKAASGGSTAYTLSAAVGSFVLTGKAMTFSVGRPLSNSPGSFVLTGRTATLSAGRPLSASLGTFTLTGKTTTLLKSLTLSGAVGSFTLTGLSQTYKVARLMSSGPGSFTISGQIATTSWPRKLSGSAGAFTLTGQDAVFVKGKGLAGTTGTFTLTGQALTFAASRSLSMSIGTFTLTGQSLSPSISRPMSAALGSFVLTGRAMTNAVARLLSLSKGSFIVTGRDATLTSSVVIVTSATIFLTGNVQRTVFVTALAQRNVNLTGDAGSNS